jgi:hypothetical protein
MSCTKVHIILAQRKGTETVDKFDQGLWFSGKKRLNVQITSKCTTKASLMHPTLSRINLFGININPAQNHRHPIC